MCAHTYTLHMHTYILAHKDTCTCIHVLTWYTHAHTYLYICMHTWTRYMHSHTHMPCTQHTHTYTHAHTFTYETHTHMHSVYTHAYTHIHAYMFTHTLTHTLLPTTSTWPRLSPVSQLCWRGKSLGRSPALVLLVGEGIRGPQWDADVRVSRAPGSGRGGGHAAPPCSQPAWGAGSVHEGRAPKLPAVLPGATACQARPGGLHPRAGLIALREGPPWWGRCSQGWSRPGGTLVLLRMGLSPDGELRELPAVVIRLVFLDDCWCRASSYTLIGILVVFICEVSFVKVANLFYTQVLCHILQITSPILWLAFWMVSWCLMTKSSWCSQNSICQNFPI